MALEHVAEVSLNPGATGSLLIAKRLQQFIYVPCYPAPYRQQLAEKSNSQFL